jgi:hypothetical protein
MGDLLKVLKLKPPRRLTPAAALPPGQLPPKPGAKKKPAAPAKPEMELIETDNTAWDNREVSEEEGQAWIDGKNGIAKIGPKTAPVREPAKDGGTPGRTQAIVIPVSFSVTIGKKLKYVEIDKLKIEGELKLAPTGDAGVVEDADVIGIPLDKKKLAPEKKYTVDLKKLAELVYGDLKKQAAQSETRVDPRLEFKISPTDANVSLGITVTSGWYSGSVKMVALAKESGKDFEFANFSVSPLGYVVKPREVDFGGQKGIVSGKLSVTVSVKPAWSAIAVDLGQKVGRRVLITVAEVLTAEVAITASFVAIAAAQIFVYVKTVSEWQDVKACAKAAEAGWLSFRSGFGSVYGLKWADGGAAALRKAGVDAATQLQQSRLKAARIRAQEESGKLPADFDAEYFATLKEQMAKDPDVLGRWVQKNYQRGIFEGFLKAYEAEHGDDYQFKSNFRALRALLGFS